MSKTLDDLSREELISRVRDLESKLDAERDERQQRVDVARSWISRMVMGSNLYKATQSGWAAWERWAFDSDRSVWPREETRDFMAALVARLTRVRTLSLLVALLPTLLILVQVWILVQQNTILERQNGLFAFEQVDNFKQRLAQDRTEATWRISYSTVAAIADFAEEQPRVVTNALTPLLLDADGSVAAGALLAFYAIDPDREILGARATYVDFEDVTLNEARLPEANFNHARFFNVRFDEADLRRANLNDTDLGGSFFIDVNLEDASLLSAKFDGADFSNADLQNADLRSADLEGAILTGANLAGANLRGIRNWRRLADISGASIRDVRNAPEGFRAWALQQGAKD